MGKSFLHIIFSISLSAIFLFAGTGYNIIQYCCNNCKNAGVEMIAEMSCESIHHQHPCGDHSQHTKPNSSAKDECIVHLDKSCSIDRVSVDVPSMQTQKVALADYSLMFSFVGTFFADIFSDSDVFLAKMHSHSPPDLFSHQVGRQILSKISTLII